MVDKAVQTLYLKVTWENTRYVHDGFINEDLSVDPIGKDDHVGTDNHAQGR